MLPPLTGDQLKSRVRKRKHSAGPGGWKPSELMHAPDAFQAIAEELNAIEQGRTWPEALLPWNQTHAQKPHKEMGVLDSMRPISVATIIYRSWSVRVRQLREHIAHTVPAEQHGAIHKRGVHTALLRMLFFWSEINSILASHSGSVPSRRATCLRPSMLCSTCTPLRRWGACAYQ